ncbi:hypothetical protein [Oceanobacter kriegii]|uniref:hypothetical protein n=1 Tax=Oceanobacter kriegii TaxID=64972 RepID=UPI00042798F5|nr:hypothetical protein [Oceanobacter kriegii]
MHKRFGGLVAAAFIATGLAGCSSGSSDSDTVTVDVRAAQGGLQDAYIWSVAVTEGGQVDTTSSGTLDYTEYDTDDDNSVDITISAEEVQQFTLIGKTYDEELDDDGTSWRCQWVDGCTDEDGNGVAFGERYEMTGERWRSVAYDLAEDEVIRITPFTDLAATLGYGLLYIESTSEWSTTGYYSAWSVLQSVNQVSKIIGVDDVQVTQPADLSRIDNYTGDQTAMLDRIRYGALVAAWINLEESWTGTDSLFDTVGAELVANSGQLMQAAGDQTLNLKDLFQSARDNLAALDVTNSTAQTYVDAVISGFDADIASLTDETLTTAVPDTIESMIGSDDYEDFTVGLARSKAFLDVLRNYGENFFEDGYREQVDAYVDMIKQVGDDNEEAFNTILTAYIQTYEFYSDCYINVGCPTPDYSEYTWLTDYDDSQISSGRLSLNGGDIVVTQRVADTNTTDEEDEPTQSHAIDVLIVGSYQSGNLIFNVDHYYEDDDEDNDIELPSAVRVYFTDEVSLLDDPATNEVLGYELRWGDFEFYDQTTLGTADELQVDGSFRLFYRGVRDPQDSTSELRFNIDTVALDGRISDARTDDDDDDDDYTNIDITATAANASEYYPDKTWASFNGFFTPNSGTDNQSGSVETALVTYRTGTQTVSGSDVQYLDLIIPMGESVRYRLYPNVLREDEDDRDDDDDTDELLYTYDTEECYLVEGDSDWEVSSCEPKDRYYGETTFEEFTNDLWADGLLSRIEVDGRGTYFVEWPAVTGDTGSCLVLDTLTEEGDSFDGTLYDELVLGLNGLRFRTMINLDGEPDTLFDSYISAPTSDTYSVTAALSHDYSSTSSSGNINIGYGSYVDRIRLSYSTSYEFDTVGSLSVYKDGASLTWADGTTETHDSTLTAYVSQIKDIDPLPYTYYVDNEGNYQRCVTSNTADDNAAFDLDTATFYLNYRDVIYGSVSKENGTWIVRYIDGTFETLQ